MSDDRLANEYYRASYEFFKTLNAEQRAAKLFLELLRANGQDTTKPMYSSLADLSLGDDGCLSVGIAGDDCSYIVKITVEKEEWNV